MSIQNRKKEDTMLTFILLIKRMIKRNWIWEKRGGELEQLIKRILTYEKI